MDDDDDSYGFGSFSDLFDGAPRAVGHAPSSTDSSLASGAASTAVITSVRATAVTSPAAPATASTLAKELDLRAMRQFWITERVLTDFQQRLKQRSDALVEMTKNAKDNERDAQEYHHVAAKFDGLTIEGGLGSAFFTALSDTHGECGLLWVQTRQSDSNAQEKRKQELQDITNQRSSFAEIDDEKSSSAIFVRVTDIVAAQPKTIQHTVRGITFLLESGNRLEISFMPGPFANATDRDDLLATIHQSMQSASSKHSSPVAREKHATTPASSSKAKTSSESGRSARDTKLFGKSNSSVPANAATKISSRTTSPAKAHRTSIASQYMSAHSDAIRSNKAESSESKAADESVDFRATIRKYLSLDESSDEAIQLAWKVHSTSGYHLGPLSKQLPKFDSDPVYKRKAVGQLSKFLDRMNQEWKENEERRVLHTKARCVSQNDLFEYIDVDSGKRVLPHEYKERFLQYVKAYDIDPFIRLLPAPTATALTDTTTSSSKQSTRTEKLTSAALSKSTSSHATMNVLSSVMGIDLTTSCIVDENFFSTYKPSIDDILDDKDSASLSEESRRALQEAQADLRKSWSAALSRYYQTKENILQQAKEHNAATATTSREQSSTAMRKRARDRRKSIIQPNPLSSLQDNRIVSTATNGNSHKVAHASDKGAVVGGSVKRHRSTQEANTPDASRHPTRRKTRRQSIVGVVGISLTHEPEKKITQGASSSTPLAAQKSPRRRHSPTATRSSEENEADGVCELCYNESAVLEHLPELIRMLEYVRGIVSSQRRSDLKYVEVKVVADVRVQYDCFEYNDIDGSFKLLVAANRYIPVLDDKLDKEDQFVKTGTKATMFGKLKAPRFPGENRCPNQQSSVSSKKEQQISIRKAQEASDRLLKWKTESNAKISQRAQFQHDMRVQEETNNIAAANLQLPREQIEAAATRNYEIASEIQWRKLRLRTQAEHVQFEAEEQECTFRPRRIAHNPKEANVQPRYLLPPPPWKTCAVKQKRRPRTSTTALKSRGSSGDETHNENVYERLYQQSQDYVSKRRQEQQAVDDTSRIRSNPERLLTDASVANFVARQVKDEANRRKSHDALVAKYAPSFVPTLSARTREISAALRTRSMDDILARERERRQRRLAACIQQSPTYSYCKKATNFFSKATTVRGDGANAPSKACVVTSPCLRSSSDTSDCCMSVADLVSELLAQEARMRALEKAL